MRDFKSWLATNEALALKGNYKGGIFQRLVAAAYEIAPISDPAAVPIYQRLAEKIARQQHMLRHDYEFVPDSGDHYRSMIHLKKSMDAQRADGTRRAKMYVYAEPPGQGSDAPGHPALSNDQNVMFRGVHDAIAHLAGSHPFSARGEYGAYSRHLKTLCDTESAKAGRCEFAKVLFTEIVGQTSYYYVYGGYTVQKAVILHDFDHYRVGLLAPNSPLNQFFEVIGKEMVQKTYFDPNALAQLPIGKEFLRQEQLKQDTVPLRSAEPNQQGARIA